jgi:hypothetical protein
MAVVWATAVLFVAAPLEAQAAMAQAAQSHHHEHGGDATKSPVLTADASSDHHHSHDTGTRSDHGTPSHPKGHNHSAPHDGSCCGTFCHSAVAALPFVTLVAPLPSPVEAVASIYSPGGIDPSGLLRPPKA